MAVTGSKHHIKHKSFSDLFVCTEQAAEAETTYKACVAEANFRQQELFKVKVSMLLIMCNFFFKKIFFYWKE